ncbi:ParA family protein [Streptomyces mirabilis]|uniref:ParA family protein n=1 Tax=Streptomyces mirabilis TaxID=68239 RepID=UPI0038250A2B
MAMTRDALLNQKGGVAKTTTTLHLARCIWAARPRLRAARRSWWTWTGRAT